MEMPLRANETMNIEFTPIGIIHSPFHDPENMPIQPTGAAGIKGRVELFAEYHAGLRDLEGFSHIILLYHFHLGRSFQLEVVPFMDTQPRGVFATRAPSRPNMIGLSIVRLEGIENGILDICNIDVLDGTPLIDIKPYVPQFDAPCDVRTGWLETTGKSVTTSQSDARFT